MPADKITRAEMRKRNPEVIKRIEKIEEASNWLHTYSWLETSEYLQITGAIGKVYARMVLQATS